MDAVRDLSVTASWASLEDYDCPMISFLNNTGADVQFRFTGDTSNTLTVPTGNSVILHTSGNAMNIQVKGPGAATGLAAIFHNP